jgi:hypothetical protein
VCRLGESRWLVEPAIQSLLLEAARTASDQTRRQAAAPKLSDPTLQADAAVRALLVEAVYDRLIPVAIRAEVVGKIRDEAALVEIACGQRAVADSVRVAAVSRLTNQVVLVEIARHALGIFLQAAAVARLTDEAVLIEMATEDANGKVRPAALSASSRYWRTDAAPPR